MKRLFILILLLACIGVVHADYIIPIESLTVSPVDAQTTYLGWMPYAPNTSALNSSTYVPANGTITAAELYEYSGTAGSNEVYRYYVRVNNAADYWIANLSVATMERRWTNTSMSIPVVKGDFIQIKRIQPTWGTNPATNIVGGYLWVNTSEQGYTLPAHSIISTPADGNSNSFGLKPIAVETTAGRNKIYIPQEGNITWAYALDFAAARKGSNESHTMYLNVSGANPGTTIATVADNTTSRTLFYNSSLNKNVGNTQYIEFFRRNPTWSTNPTNTVLGALVWVNTSITSGTRGVAYPVQALTSTPTDAQVVYFGNLPKAPVTTEGTSKIYMGVSGKISRAAINVYSGTAGTAENWNLSIRKGNTVSQMIENIAASANERIFNNESMNIPVVAGDWIEIQGKQPVWVTNPATTIYGGWIWVEPSLPAVNFTSDVSSGYSPQQIHFEDTSLYTISRNWSYNNVTGNNTEIWWSTLKNPIITFGVGNWSIKLNATNELGYNISSTPYFVNISPLPPTAVTVKFYAANASDGRISNLTTEPYYTKRLNTHGTIDATTALLTMSGVSLTATTMYSDSLVRYAWSANTSSLPDDSTILDAVYSVAGEYGTSKAAGNFTFGITGFSPADPAALAGGDYDTFGNISYSPTFLKSDDSNTWRETYGNNFTFNAVGINNISKIGYTSLMLRFKDDIYNTTSEFNNTISATTIVKGYQNDTVTENLKPYLVVRYLPAAVSVPVASFTSNVTNGTVPLGVNFTDTSTNVPTSWNWSYRSLNILTPNQANGTESESTSDISGYCSPTITSSTEQAYQGTRSIKAVAVDNASCGDYYAGSILWGDIFVPNGTVYTASGWVLAQNGYDVYFGIRGLKQLGGNVEYHTDYGAGDGTWKYYNRTYTATENLTKIGVQYFIVGGSAGIYTYGDKFQVEKGSVNTTWQLPATNNITYFNSSQNPTYLFDRSGNFSVYLNVSNAGGFNITPSDYWINVSPVAASAPVSSFTVQKSIVRIPNLVSVTDTSTNTPTSWQWSWGDGTANSTTQNPTHQYTKRGKFTINLAATNAGGTGVATAQTVRIVGYENYSRRV